jgi:uncharacterized protein (DUF885 family)
MKALSVLCATLFLQPAFGAQSDVAARLTAQRQLFAELENEANASESALALQDYSITAAIRQNMQDRRLLARASTLSVAGFPQEERISHDLVLFELKERIEDFRLKTYEMPLSLNFGVLTDLSYPPVQPDTALHAQQFLVWLRSIPRGLEQTEGAMKAGERDGLVLSRFSISPLVEQCHQVSVSGPFADPPAKLSNVIPEPTRSRLGHAIETTLSAQVRPALVSFCAFLGSDYSAHGRTTIGIGGLPQGQERYRQLIRENTTTEMSAKDVHSLGLREVARINSELLDVAHRAGYPNLINYRESLKNNPKYTPTSPDQIVSDFRRYVSNMKPKLALLFNDVPDTSMAIAAMSPNERPNITHHVNGSDDGRVPGRVLVAVSDFAKRSMIGDETIAYHEGLPGHELQIAIQNRLKGLPAFRREMQNNAYTEGWAVYAEALGKEVGLFQDPASDYGRLNTELMRAVRLVVDTGINADGWSRNRAVAYWRASGSADEPTIQAEIDRSISWPAQGLSYKIGQLKILGLRQRAQLALGNRFDLKIFHDQVLDSGNLPLSELEAKIDHWIASQKSAAARA